MKTEQDLRSIQSQAILRLNCPGYGQASALTRGSARHLTEYKVIIVNPLSILHIFDGQADIVRQIDIAISDGLTSFKLADDQLINKLSSEIELRSQEILQFLGQGGLLVYYLCRPFVLTGSSRFLDNYAWLCGLAPDQSGQSTLSVRVIRHMSTAAHGRNIDKTDAADSSGFSKYFDQSGLEWNTIIRAEYLSEGYTALALAGPKKCISGQLMVGDGGGQVVFLPAPYSPDFDRTLIDCIYQCHTNNLTQDSSPIPEIAPAAEPVLEKSQKDASPHKTEVASVSKSFSTTVVEPCLNPPPADIKTKPTEENIQSAKKSTPEKVLEELRQSLPATATPAPAPVPHVEKDLPEKTNMPRKEADIENWAANYSLLGIDKIVAETQAVREQITQLERQIASQEEMFGFLEAVKAPLLSGKGGSLVESCKMILNAFGWASKALGSNPEQLLLNENGQPIAITQISLSKGSVERAQLARLAESMINYWNEQTSELKGILIACPFADTVFDQRQEPDFTEMVIEFARRKNVCLLSTLQLLHIYRDIGLGKVDGNSIRQTILACSGCLPGFTK